MRIHHVGFLCKRLKESEAEFIKLGFAVEVPAQYDAGRKINIEFLVNGGYRVELIEPADKSSPLYPLLKYFKNAPYHFCYETSDIKAAMEKMEKDGFHVIDAPSPAPCIPSKADILPTSALFLGGATYARVAFLMSAAGMAELLER